MGTPEPIRLRIKITIMNHWIVSEGGKKKVIRKMPLEVSQIINEIYNGILHHKISPSHITTKQQ